MLFLVCPDKEDTIFSWRMFDLGGDTKPLAGDTYMVLDGQQRYQSILTAFSCKSKGCEQTESYWRSLNCRTEGVKPAECIPKFLCFNLKAFSANGQMKTHVDVADAEDANENAWLIWKTREEISESFGQYVKLYDTPDPAYNREAADWLESKQQDIHKLLVPVLEISDEENARFADGEAEEQIVEIFTRLNTQGCPLTREQILSAKIKQVWDGFPDKVENLRSHLEGAPYYMGKITDDDLVTGFNSLIRADKREKDINAAYRQVDKEEWAKLWERFETLTTTLFSALVERVSIRYKKEYQSLHAVWFIIALVHRCEHNIAGGNYTWNDQLLHLIVKWLMLGNWSRIWANRSGQSVANLTNKITSVQLAKSDPYENLRLWLNDESLNIKARSLQTLEGLQASARGSVRIYYTYLLIWMRQSSDRAKLLSKFNPGEPNFEVDHILPANWVKSDINHFHILNRLGNCWLLGGKANSAKKDKEFQQFLEAAGVTEEENVPTKISADELVRHTKEETKAWNDSIGHAIDDRENKIKESLRNYIKNDEANVIELSYVKDQNTEGIYRGDEFLRSIQNVFERTQQMYLLGVQQAYQLLGWTIDCNPFTKLANPNMVMEYVEDHLAKLRGAVELNGTYKTGWRRYLDFLRGRHREGGGHGHGEGHGALGMAVHKIQNFPPIDGHLNNYQSVVRAAINMGCSDVVSINRDELINGNELGGETRYRNALAAMFHDEPQHNGRFFEVVVRKMIRFDHDAWVALQNIDWI